MGETKVVVTVTMAETILPTKNVLTESIQLKENVMDFTNVRMVTDIQINIAQKVSSLMGKFATGQKTSTAVIYQQSQKNQLSRNNLSNQRNQLNQNNLDSISINV